MKYSFYISWLMIIMLAVTALTACTTGSGTPTSEKNEENSLVPSNSTGPVQNSSLPVSQTTSATSPTAASPALPYTPVISDPVITDLNPTDYGVGVGITRHDFFTQAQIFSFEIYSGGKKYNNWNKPPVQAKFISQEDSTYKFEMVESGDSLKIVFPAGSYTDLKLTQGMNYQISAQILTNMSLVLGLVISQDDQIIFAGVSDRILYGPITIVQGPFTFGYPKFDVKQGPVLKDNYLEINNNTSAGRITNLEIQFSLGDRVFGLHQGQSANLGDYKIELLAAYNTEIQYKTVVTDTANGDYFSYTITKLVESRPLSIQSPGDEVVKFTDPALEALIRRTLGISDRAITRKDLYAIKALIEPVEGITNLSGIEKCQVLYYLVLDNNRVKDLSPCFELPELVWLSLKNNQISDLTSLRVADLKRLTFLSLNRNKVTDISALAGLTRLNNLELSFNQIFDISALSSLTNLQNLAIDNNMIKTILPLSSLTGMKTLDLSFNALSDISALAELTNLETLKLDLNRISDITALANLPLSYLSLNDNQISDIKPLVENMNLVKGAKIYLKGNPLNEKSINEYIPELENRGIKVYR